MFDEIPRMRPVTPLLDQIGCPSDLKKIDKDMLPQLCNELRAYLLFTVGRTGGHFGAGLGVVELTVALHYTFDLPDDQLIWDVGHQAYPHKILSGRREQMKTMRQAGGIKGFPCRSESQYDAFGVGHSSTSISAALGMALSKRIDQIEGKSEGKVVAVIGDGAMTAGMAFEALNHAGHENADVLLILNDNRMSISENVGGLSNYLARVWASRTYNALRASGKKVLQRMPGAHDFAKKTEEHVKGMFSPGTLFEELGFNHIGPIDGHNIEKLVDYLERLKDMPGPRILHVVTQKGKGFAPAEADPIGYHALNKLEPNTPKRPVAGQQATQNQVKVAPTVVAVKEEKLKYSDVFGEWLCELASTDERVIAITPAMREGSGLVNYSKQFPKRYFDVAIAEQHAVTLAAGFACEGKKPIVAIYSTFLQRAYDQLIHDVAIQNLDVLFAIDRAGLVGEDGPTHAGSFDLSFLRCIPNLIIMSPSDEAECRNLLYTGYQYPGPSAVRYPRGKGVGASTKAPCQLMPIGEGRVVRKGQRVAILVFGSLLHVATMAADRLDATLVDMRFVKPLDETLILDLVSESDLLVTVEENAIAGGAGSAVNELLSREGALISMLNLGLPDDFISHGKAENLLAEAGLDQQGILAAIEQRLALLEKTDQRHSGC